MAKPRRADSSELEVRRQRRRVWLSLLATDVEVGGVVAPPRWVDRPGDSRHRSSEPDVLVFQALARALMAWHTLRVGRRSFAF